jgi:ABC-2 type transport system permease protein
MIFWAFYKSAAVAAPVPFNQVADYIWLGQAFLMMTRLEVQDPILLKSVTSGQVSYELCRPCNIYSLWFSRLIAFRLSGVIINAVAIMLAAFFLPPPYSLHPPAGCISGILFLVSIMSAAFLVAALSMFIYLLTFITLSPMGPRLLIGVAGEFLMGSIVPVPLMPKLLQQILDFLPFRYAADLPFRIYSGNIAGKDALSGIALQFVWIIILMLIGGFCFKKIQKRLLIQGG